VNLVENDVDTGDITATAAPLMTGSPTAVEEFDGDVLERTLDAMQNVIRDLGSLAQNAAGVDDNLTEDKIIEETVNLANVGEIGGAATGRFLTPPIPSYDSVMPAYVTVEGLGIGANVVANSIEHLSLYDRETRHAYMDYKRVLRSEIGKLNTLSYYLVYFCNRIW
jgi:hypothetical protein